jgi:hypothetical protein
VPLTVGQENSLAVVGVSPSVASFVKENAPVLSVVVEAASAGAAGAWPAYQSWTAAPTTGWLPPCTRPLRVAAVLKEFVSGAVLVIFEQPAVKIAHEASSASALRFEAVSWAK